MLELLVSSPPKVSEQNLQQQIKSENMKVSANKREEKYVSGLTITPKFIWKNQWAWSWRGLNQQKAYAWQLGLNFIKKYVSLILELAKSVEGNLPLKQVLGEANPILYTDLISTCNETTPTFSSIRKTAAPFSIPKLVFNPSLNQKQGIPWVGAAGYGVSLDTTLVIDARLNSSCTITCGGSDQIVYEMDRDSWSDNTLHKQYGQMSCQQCWSAF